VADLEHDKRAKERQSKAVNVTGEREELEALERQLKRNLRDKEEEAERLKDMIRDRKVLLESKRTFARNDEENKGADTYAKLSSEIDSVKLMVLNLRASEIGVDISEAKPAFSRKLQQKTQYNYPLSQIEAFVELKLPKAKGKRDKYEGDRVLMRQLVANIDRNRMKIRKELLDTRGADQLSHGRRVAIASVKERIDEQARLLEQEERVLKERGDYYRRKEDRLRIMRQKIDIVKAED